MNTLVYIHSGRPDLRRFKDSPRLRGGPGSGPVNRDKNISSREVVLVGFSHKKSPIYTAARWDVRMHERHIKGPGGEARLVFVEAHERGRRKASDIPVEQGPQKDD